MGCFHPVELGVQARLLELPTVSTPSGTVRVYRRRQPFVGWRRPELCSISENPRAPSARAALLLEFLAACRPAEAGRSARGAVRLLAAEASADGAGGAPHSNRE